MNNPVILFDGVCNLCNRSVQFVIRHDRMKQFRFASLQSKTGVELLEKFGLAANDLNSFVLIDGNRAFTRSRAALEMVKKVGGGWKLFYSLIILPKILRDGVYNWVSRNRYRWFGKREACMIPSADLKDRFLE